MSRDVPRITVVGDLMLDRYLIGDATRLNPEQPGVVIRVEREEDRLGGAGAVAMLATSLGAFVVVAGVIGRDETGRRILELLDAHDIGTHVWRDDRPTTWKQRIIARGQIRPDRCDREVAVPVLDDAMDFLTQVPIGDVILIQDYGKGVCTKSVLNKLIERAQSIGVPILVDPARSRDWADYGGVSLIKANWAEAREQCADAEMRPIELAESLSRKHQCHVIITLGEHGLACAELGGTSWHVPASPVANVRDVCGAGDTVLATCGISVARGETLRNACELSVTLAAEQVSRVGVSPIVVRA